MRRVFRFYFLEAAPDNPFLVPMRLWFTLATTAAVIFFAGWWRYDGSLEPWLFIVLSAPVGIIAMGLARKNYRKARTYHETHTEQAAAKPAAITRQRRGRS